MADFEMMGMEETETSKADLKDLENQLKKKPLIDPNLYVEYDVKRGLRDSAGKGVLTGLTKISDVSGHQLINGRRIPAEGSLYY